MITLQEIKQLVNDFGVVVDLDRWETPGSDGQRFLRIKTGSTTTLEPLILYREDVETAHQRDHHDPNADRTFVTTELQLLLIRWGGHLKTTAIRRILDIQI